jgi:hypothetical protein
VADPHGGVLLTYEHPLGSDVKGKNTTDTLSSTLTGGARALAGSVTLLGSAVGQKMGRIFK